MISESIEAHREEFCNNLVGRWGTAQGRFSIMMGEIWEFWADGFGRVIHYSVLLGEMVHPFEWQQTADYRLRVDLGAGAKEIHYEFVHIGTDTGRRVGLVQHGQIGFGGSGAPLAYEGPVSEGPHLERLPARRRRIPGGV